MNAYHSDITKYSECICKALAESGNLPRHCVYNRKRYLDNECYIDDDGVTVSISPERSQTGDNIYKIRTAYRPMQGKGKREKRIEAVDNAVLDGIAFSIKDFERFLAQKSQKGSITQKFSEETWIRIK